MPNWQKIVRAQLESSSLPPSQRDDVIRELAAHLEECYAQARSEGLADEAAVEHTLQQVQDWPVLAEDIRRAKPQEVDMNHRTKTVWLPGIAILFGTGLLLVFLDRAASLQRIIWIACMVMLICAAATESNRLSHRTKSFWLPGFASLAAASLFLFTEEFVLTRDPSFDMADLSLHPQHVASGLPLWLYGAWLLAQVLCGALGAFVSRRGGGSIVARIVAGAFPALMMLVILALVIPIGVVFYVLSHPSCIALVMLIWAGGPAVALLLGAAPFLRELPLHRA
ncbi:MAG: hypothetical protein WA741_15425 [Candidatus Sulfotelmatobacter sp.]